VLRAKLADLARIEAALSKLVGECQAHRRNVSCPLIAALHVRFMPAERIPALKVYKLAAAAAISTFFAGVPS
jgi:hypothetical protein